jgi:hypothetical protein
MESDLVGSDVGIDGRRLEAAVHIIPDDSEPFDFRVMAEHW